MRLSACAVSRTLRDGLVLGLLLLVAAASRAAEVDARKALFDELTHVSVLPKEVVLSDARAMQQLVVTGHYADGQVRDLTTAAEFGVADGRVAFAEPSGLIHAGKEGSSTIFVIAGRLVARVPVTVSSASPRPVSFRHEFIAALNVGGCNAGACHGTPSGKNGFRLSLRGYDPDADHVQLTRDVLGRRTATLNAEESLVIQKALGRVPHEGGQRFAPGSLPHRVLASWIAEGLQDDARTLPPITKVEVLPGDRVQTFPGRWQQLAVLAHFGNGVRRDVTLLTNFSSSDPAIAEVSRTGLVEFKQPGETAILARYLDQMVTIRLTFLQPRQDFVWSDPPEHNYIDKHIFAKLKMMNIVPSGLCTDQEFLRRACLDLCGVQPTAAEAKAFLESKDPDKRSKLIDQLLDRPEYADFWTLKWADVLRANRKTLQLAGVHKYQEWIKQNLKENRPFDQWVRELVTADGSTYANPAANFYRVAREPTNLAETTAQLFFGVRMQCAKCHNHPFERWTQDDYYSLAAFFARVKLKRDPTENTGVQPNQGAELVFLDRAGEITQPRTNQTMPPRFPGQVKPVSLAPGLDRREALAEWLTRPDNPFLPKSVVNRVWFHLLGKGIVDPVDDFRDSNPACNDELLAALSRDFTEKGFNLKHVIRTIMNSRTYQLSAATNPLNKDDSKYFSHAVTRMHTAEQLLDAICDATAMPEKFAGLPLGTRATQLPDGEVNHVFLKTFGQPARELACECERENESNLAQALQLINGPTIHEKLRNPNNRIGQLLGQKKSDIEILNELYFATVSRAPDAPEIKAVIDHLAKNADKRKAWEDVQWALINSKEFLFRH
jgi:hypothetical protein